MGNSVKEREDGDVGIGGATALVVNSEGAAAWIASVDTEAQGSKAAEHKETSEYRVHVTPSGSKLASSSAPERTGAENAASSGSEGYTVEDEVIAPGTHAAPVAESTGS